MDHPGIDVLTSLPDDILLSILAACPAISIIRIRQAMFSFLSHISKDLFLWLEVVKAYCLEMEFPRSALVGENSSPSRQDLERITMGHRALLARLRKQSPDSVIEATRTRTIAGQLRFHSVKLVPGGRFLVSSTLSNIQLWDLGLESSDIYRLAATAEVPDPWELGETDLIVHRFSWTGDTLHVAVSLHCHTVRDIVITIFVRETVTLTCLLGRVSFHIGDEAVGIHDFATGIGIKWYTDGLAFDYADLVPNERGILVATSCERMIYAIYPIPADFSQFQDRRPDSDGLIVIENPPIVLKSWSSQLKDLGAPESCLAMGLTRWASSYHNYDSAAMCIDFWAQFNDDEIHVEHVRLLTDQTTTDEPTLFLRQHIAAYPNLFLRNNDIPYSKTFPDGTRAIWWEVQDNAHLRIHVSDFARGPSESETGTIDLNVDLPEERHRIYWARYSFEPILRRAVVIKADYGLQVLDYIA
ncbi:hypothetical protein DL96DRAFT_1710020 [Flagelloscypha sp. PMI_526]|nr:hypothetical protein DL96DRAFT_1710020 [Flagelloscypha sp. PMI_526]